MFVLFDGVVMFGYVLFGVCVVWLLKCVGVLWFECMCGVMLFVFVGLLVLYWCYVV